jgi:hypothetical protein
MKIMFRKIIEKSPWIKLYIFFHFLTIIYYKKFSIKEKILLKGKKYLNKCLKGKLNRKTYINFLNPRVTIIIPIFNCQNNLMINQMMTH